MNLKKCLLIYLPVLILLTMGCSWTSNLIPNTSPTAQLPEPSATINQPPESSLGGLVYRTYDKDADKNTLWQVGTNGKPQFIMDYSAYNFLAFSPDGKQAVYDTTDNCIWLADSKRKQLKPLDCSLYTDAGTGPSTREMTFKSWIPGQTDTILVFLNVSTSYGDGPVPSIATGDIGTYSILDANKKKLNQQDNVLLGSVVLSPDGNSIISQDTLYSFSSTPTKFIPQEYGAGKATVENPAWSPDSKKLAWGISDGEWGIGIFDLEKKTAKILHRYPSPSVAGFFPLPSPTWNPNGQWIIFYADVFNKNQTINQKESGWWVLRADGTAEHKLDGDFGNSEPNWSPNGEWLLYSKKDASNKTVLMVSHPDGTQSAQLQTTSAFTLWSPDGSSIVFADEQGVIWLAKAGVWKFTRTAIKLPAKTDLFSWPSMTLASYTKLEVLPTPTQEAMFSFSCPQAPRTRMKPNDTGRITFTDGSTTRLRSKPEAGDNMVANLAEGTEFIITDGPICYPRPGRNDAYVYWKISVPSKKLTGWVAEADFNNYYIEPWPKKH